MKLLKALVLAAALAAGSASADELIINTVSTHFKHNSQENGKNFGGIYRFSNDVIVGSYNNSQSRVSVLIGYYVPLVSDLYPLGIGVVVGGVTGYNHYAVMPAAVLSVSYPLDKHWGDEHLMMYVNVAPVEHGVASLAFGYKF